jgi:hypothetical protein
MRDQSKITSLTRSLLEWTERPANARFLCHEQGQVLASSAREPQRRAQVPVAAWLLGTWHLGSGLARVLQGDARGFDSARIGQALRRSSLLQRRRHRSGRLGSAELPFSLTQAALTVLFGLAFDDPRAEPLYELLRAVPDRRFAADDHLALLARELLALRAGQRSTLPKGLGPYQEVILHWHGDPHVFAQKIATALDHHLREADRRGSPFEDPPTRVFPVEVLALANVRRSCELPMPKVEHALMFTNMVTMQPCGPWPHDELVARLERT